MAGLGYKVWSAGDVLAAADLNGYVAEQVTMVFNSSGVRGSALGTAVAEGMVSYLKDTDALEYYTTTWQTVPALQTANTFTATQTATAFAVNGTAIPTNGVYLPSANTLGFSTNSTQRATISSSGAFTIQQNLNVGTGTGASVAGIEVGAGRTLDGNALIDFIGDTTYTDYGLRIIRSGGANSQSLLEHRGTGGLFFRTVEAGFIGFETTNARRVTISSTGRLGNGVSLTSSFQFAVYNTQSASDVTAVFRNFAGQTADAIKVRNSADADVFAITPAGWIKYVTDNTAAFAGSLQGYIKIDIGGTEYKVPYYAAS